MTSIAELYGLQELDLAIEAKRSALTDAEAGMGEPQELSDARVALAESEATLHATEKQFKEREYEADDLRAKIEPVEKKLYEGKVSNPKELEDLQQDLDSLKRRRSELEDVALEAMEALEEAQRAHEEAKRTFEEVTTAHETGQLDLESRQATLQREIVELERERADYAAALEDGALLRLYEQIAATHQGRGVAKVEGGRCSGCRISLPVNVLQRARAGAEVVQCSSCTRILYVS